MKHIRPRLSARIARNGVKAILMIVGISLAAVLSSTHPTNAAPLNGNMALAKPRVASSPGLVQLAHKRRYRHCHGLRRCHGRGEYYRYTPTPHVYVPRYYVPYGYGYGSGWGYYGGFDHRNGHHFGGHHGGHHFEGHHGGHHGHH